MLTNWHFGAGGEILGNAFLTEKCEKLEFHLKKTVEIHQWVVISRGSHPNLS